MDTQQAYGFQQVLTHMVGDIAQAVSERNGETPRQRNARSEAAVFMILGFLPRDVIEALIAGHCVMLHELVVDSVRHTLTGEMETTRRATRGGIVAMDKAFGTNLTRLEHYQERPSVGCQDAAPADVPVAMPADAPVDAPANVAVETAAEACVDLPIAAPVDVAAPMDTAPNETLAARVDITVDAPVAVSEVTVPVAATAPSVSEIPATLTPSAAAIASCRANPEAMAALDAGDPERFARAMGIEHPSEAFLEAATAPGGPFDLTVPAHRRPLVSRLPG